MSAYLIADVEVNDADAYAEYRRRFDPILERFGGRHATTHFLTLVEGWPGA